MPSNPSPEEKTPSEGYSKSSSPSRELSSASISNSSNKIKKKIGELTEKIRRAKNKKETYFKENKELIVLRHKERINAEQRDYLESINKSNQKEYILGKLVDIDEKVDNYSDKFLEGKLDQPDFEKKASKTMDSLKVLLSNIERLISVDATAKKLLGGRKRIDGRPLIKGVEIPKLKMPAVPRLDPYSRKSSSSDKKPSIDSKKRKSDDDEAPTKLARQKLDGKQFRVKNKYRGLPKKDQQMISKLVKIEGGGGRRLTRPNPEFRKYQTAGLIKQVRNLDTMPDAEVVKLFKAEGLKFDVVKDGKARKRGDIVNLAPLARKRLKRHYEEIKPGREILIKEPAEIVPLVISPEEMAKITTRPIKPGPQPPAVRVRRPVRAFKRRRSPPKEYKVTDEVFDPYNIGHNQIVKVKGKGMITKMRSPVKPFSEEDLEKSAKKQVDFDPRPTWLWEPKTGTDKLNKKYLKYREKVVKAISRASSGNQMILFTFIERCHRILQEKRAEMGKILKLSGKKEAEGKKQALFKNFDVFGLFPRIFGKRLVVSPKQSKKLSLKDLYVPVQGQIRPGRATAAPANRLVKIVPKEVLQYSIPPHYKRIEVLTVPKFIKKDEEYLDSAGKIITRPGKVKDAQTKDVLRTTPDWEQVRATGDVTQEAGTTYKKVTVADLERYLGETYLRKIDAAAGERSQSSGPAISRDVRAYAYQNAVDLAKIKGTRKKGGVRSRDYEITREDIDKFISGSVSQKSDTPSEDKRLGKLSRLFVKATEVGNLTAVTKYKRAGKKQVKEKEQILTEEQFEKLITGRLDKKKISGVPTVAQKDKALKQVRQIYREIKGAKMSKTKNKEQAKRWLDNIEKIIANIEQGKYVDPPKLKRRIAAKATARGGRFMRVQEDSSSGSKSSPSSAKSSSSAKKSASKSSAKKSASRSSSSSVSLDLKSLEEKLAEDLRADAKRDKKRDTNQNQETLDEMIKRLEREKKIRAVPRQFAPPMNVSKPMKKAYPGVTMEDLFGEDYEEVPSPPPAKRGGSKK